MGDSGPRREPVEITAKEYNLIKWMRRTPFGSFTVIMHSGEPSQLETVTKKVKL